MTAGFMPEALDRNIPPGENDPEIEPCGTVLHVRDGLGDSLHDFFNGPSGGVESHFYVRFTGVIEQYRSIFFEADANLDGNRFTLDGRSVGFVSIETEGHAAGEWTAAQVASIKRIILWVRSQQAFPLRVCPAWNAPGVGYHTMWGSPSHWTPVAKSCPGPDRIKQFTAVLVPWMADPTLEEDVTPEQMKQLLDAIKAAGMITTTNTLAGLGDAKISTNPSDPDAPTKKLAYHLVEIRNLELKDLARQISVEANVDQASIEAALRKVLGSLDAA